MDITPALSIRLQWTARPIIEPPSESPKHLQPTIPATVWPCGACAASCCARACAGEVALICGRWASVALILLRFGAVLSYRSLDLWEELELEGRCITKTARLSKPFCSFEEMFKQIPVPHHQDIYIYIYVHFVAFDPHFVLFDPPQPSEHQGGGAMSDTASDVRKKFFASLRDQNSEVTPSSSEVSLSLAKLREFQGHSLSSSSFKQPREPPRKRPNYDNRLRTMYANPVERRKHLRFQLVMLLMVVASFGW